jgi:FkbM family methyltransferase
VILEKTALSDHNGLEKLYISPSSVRHSLLSQEEKTTSIEVIVKTLDTLLEELNIKKVDIIKIDAEGAEMAILKGAEKTLKSNPNAKIIVASYHYPSEIKEVQNFLHKMGFKTKISLSNIVITI